MSKDDFLAVVDSSYDNGTPLWIYTKDYVYGMVPTAGEKWLEVVYDLHETEDPLVQGQKGVDFAFQLMLEELTKGVSFYVEDLNVQKLKDFASGVEAQADRIEVVINELISNTGNYSANLPIIKSKDELATLKGKI